MLNSAALLTFQIVINIIFKQTALCIAAISKL